MNDRGHQNQALVSVVIPVRDGVDHIGRAIESALRQSWRPIEVIVVDDGSSDGTTAVVEGFGDPVCLIRQAAAGPAAARNRGIRQAQGDYIALLDADDVWLPGRVERTVRPMIEDDSIGLCYCRCTLEGRRQAVHRHVGKKLHPDGIYAPDGLFTPAATLRREAFEQVGGYDDAMNQCEDIDLFVRIAERYEVRRIEAALVVVSDRPDSHSKVGRHPGRAADMVLYYHAKALVRRPERYGRLGAISAACRIGGIFHFDAGRYRTARGYFGASWWLRPTVGSLVLFMRTFLPKWVNRWVRRIK